MNVILIIFLSITIISLVLIGRYFYKMISTESDYQYQNIDNKLSEILPILNQIMALPPNAMQTTDENITIDKKIELDFQLDEKTCNIDNMDNFPQKAVVFHPQIKHLSLEQVQDAIKNDNPIHDLYTLPK